jgi:hypothetical protein
MAGKAMGQRARVVSNWISATNFNHCLNWGGSTLIRKYLLLSILGALSAGTALAAGEQAVTFDRAFAKQLAGPASEIRSMRAPSPVEATIHSKAALLKVNFHSDKAGRKTWTSNIPVEKDSLRFLVFADTESSQRWQANLVNANGRGIARTLSGTMHNTHFGMNEASIPATQYEYVGLSDGSLNLTLEADAKAKDGFVLIEGDSSTELASYPTHLRQLVGERIGVTALLTRTHGEDKVLVGKAAGRIDSAVLRVTAPDGSEKIYPMFDDGLHDDGVAGDGLFGGDYPATEVGNYLAQVEVRGVNSSGRGFVRTAEHLTPIVERSIDLAAASVQGVASEPGRVAIQVPVVARKNGQHYRAIAEVWGRDAQGKDVAVAWVGGMVQPENGTLDIGMDQRWVTLSGAKGPFELRNLRIEDPDHFVTVARAERLALQLPPIRSLQSAKDIVIDEAMTMGPRPSEQSLMAGESTNGVGKRLILVHGYCSGGVWPTSQFTTASTFLDANKNRTNDAFALLIKNFGATWNSFGTIAHSQGGMASLHLYAYYWSGLDNATGNRLIQSVGTPYRGTNLSGILAKIGNWFGVACGSNSNLTYSGATSWLSGIPNSARAKVNYYTTSFKLTNWYTNDYCQIATDLVLDDPEDGTTEQVNGQLSGGVNRGHTTGQCHTASMRDPAQYLDSSRNATMNSNAAR